jgi:Icc-related predicted phosphoesterase
MKLAVFSDTHTYHRRMQLPEADVLVCCGDITASGEESTVLDLIDWITEELPRRGRHYRHKILVPGNHDFCLDIRSSRFVEGLHAKLEDHGIMVCMDRKLEIDGVMFYGTPWVHMPGWAFHDGGKNRFRIAGLATIGIPENTQVLLSHSPPLGILDRCPGGEMAYHVGSQDLLRAVRSLPRLKVHAFGHIHEGYGQQQEEGGPLFVNACICTRAYEPTNDPILVEFQP